MAEKKPNINALTALELSKLPRGAISRTGTPVARNSRLPSIKGPRDLTLGSGLKRTFTPNIPVRREKKSDQNDSQPSSAGARRNTAANSRGGGNRGRGREKKVFLQTTGGLFGEGIANAPKNASFRSNDCKPSPSLPKPVIKKESRLKSEPQKTKILDDDFIDDGSDSDDSDVKIEPIAIPIPGCRCAPLLKKEPVVDKKECDIVIKKEKLDEYEEETEPLSDFERLCVSSDSLGQEDLVLVELSDYARPTLPDVPDEGGSRDNQSSDVAAQKASKKRESLLVRAEGCDGYLGKLQFMSDGSFRIVVGQHVFDGFSGPANSFLQEAVAVHRIDNSVTDMISIGSVKHEVKFLPSVSKLYA